MLPLPHFIELFFVPTNISFISSSFVLAQNGNNSFFIELAYPRSELDAHTSSGKPLKKLHPGYIPPCLLCQSTRYYGKQLWAFLQVSTDDKDGRHNAWFLSTLEMVKYVKYSYRSVTTILQYVRPGMARN